MRMLQTFYNFSKMKSYFVQFGTKNLQKVLRTNYIGFNNGRPNFCV